MAKPVDKKPRNKLRSGPNPETAQQRHKDRRPRIWIKIQMRGPCPPSNDIQTPRDV